MTKILAVDTATEACSAALFIDGRIISEKEVAPQGHTRLLLPMTDRLLKEAGLSLRDLDALAAGRGPGSFTGVRIGVSMAQGLAFGAGKPLIGISDLMVMAFQALEETGLNEAVASIDARMGEVYLGVFRMDPDGFPELLGEERVLAPEIAASYAKELLSGNQPALTGTGFAAYPRIGEALNGIPAAENLPWADTLARLALRDYERGLARAPGEILPVYIRDQVTWKKVAEQELERQQRRG